VDSDALAEQPRGAEVQAEPPLREDRREAGAVGAPRDVGGKCEAEPGADTQPVDLGDDGDRAVVDGEHDVGEDAHRVDGVPGWTVP
jgi:hypothetical protein